MWLASLIFTWLFLSPVVYASFAGRAAANLVETETYHKWAFGFFVVSTLGCVTLWLTMAPDIICSEQQIKWEKTWHKHWNEQHNKGVKIESK